MHSGVVTISVVAVSTPSSVQWFDCSAFSEPQCIDSENSDEENSPSLVGNENEQVDEDDRVAQNSCLPMLTQKEKLLVLSAAVCGKYRHQTLK